MDLSIKYIIEFGSSGGVSKRFYGETLEEVRMKIDKDLDLDKGLKRILKYGYFDEIEEGFKSNDYVIDNCMHFNYTNLLYMKES